MITLLGKSIHKTARKMGVLVKSEVDAVRRRLSDGICAKYRQRLREGEGVKKGRMLILRRSGRF